MKSWKREVAGGGLAFWAVVSAKLFFLAAPETIPPYQAIYGSLTAVVWTAAGAAFGLHAILARRPPMGGNNEH